MHIVHLISNLEFGGAETSLCALVESEKAIAQRRHTVISMLRGGALRDRLETAGANVVELSGNRGGTGAFLLGSVRRAIAEVCPDVLQCWMYHANVAASVAKLTGGMSCPIAWGVRQGAETIRHERFSTKAVMLASVLFSRLPRRIVYNSAEAAKDHERLRYARSGRIVIPNGIDCERFRPRMESQMALRSELGISGEDFVIGRIARVAPMKDYPTLFDAYAALRAEKPRVHLVVVGPKTGDEIARIRQMAAGRGVSEHLHIMPPVSDIERYYSVFDLLISSSSSNEGFPNSVGEAMASGVPVIATRVGERGLLRGCYRIVEPRDANLLADAMADFLSLQKDKREAARKSARAFMIHNYSLEANRQAYADLWAGMLKQHEGHDH